MTRVAYVDKDGETVELAAGDAERVLARDPGLRRECAKWIAMTKPDQAGQILAGASCVDELTNLNRRS